MFESVSKSSNQYWSSSNPNANKTKRPTPGSQTIVADTMGALMFVYSGPMSIIAGGISSLFVNEAIEQH